MKTKKQKRKLPIISAILGMLLVATVVFACLVMFDQLHESEPEMNNADINTATLYENTESDDESNDEKKNTYDAKDAYEADTQKDNQNSNNSSDKKNAELQLNINQSDTLVIASARVVNFKEEGGKCLYSLTNGDTTKEYSKEVLPDAKTMVCEALEIKKSELTSGKWKVKVEYKSDYAEGVSDFLDFTVE